MDEFSAFHQKALDGNVIPVVETMPADLLTPLSVYLKLAGRSENSFLLESVAGGENLARYSFIGADPKTTLTGDDTTHGTDVWNRLRKHFSERNCAADPNLPAFIGGAIGYLGFNCAEWFEPSLARADPGRKYRDDAAFMFFRSIVAFDHVRQVIKIISLVFTDEAENEDSLAELYELAAARNKQTRRLLEHGEMKLPPPAQPIPNATVESNWRREDFEDAVLQIKELIAAGECYQVVLSQRSTRATTASPVAIYRAVRSLNPSPYMFLLRFGQKSIVGASPERLISCEEGKLNYRPIAGTRARGATPQADERLAEQMRKDKKEVAEHLMLVDLGRNDVGRVAEFGSVEVDALMNVEKYSHVQHLVSSISARLRPGLDRFDALAACFPAGTVSGAPKVRAIEIIRDLEPTPRGVFAGAVGYFDYSGNMDTCIAIRTLVLEDGIATVQAGAGIVADSVPASEFEETVIKARAMLKAVEIAESGEM